MLCAYFAGALLVGLLGNALVGAWWLDPAVGLLIAAVAANEGLEAWRGEGCCVSSPLDGLGFVKTPARSTPAPSASRPAGVAVVAGLLSLQAQAPARQRPR